MGNGFKDKDGKFRPTGKKNGISSKDFPSFLIKYTGTPAEQWNMESYQTLYLLGDRITSQTARKRYNPDNKKELEDPFTVNTELENLWKEKKFNELPDKWKKLITKYYTDPDIWDVETQLASEYGLETPLSNDDKIMIMKNEKWVYD